MASEKLQTHVKTSEMNVMYFNKPSTLNKQKPKSGISHTNKTEFFSEGKGM